MKKNYLFFVLIFLVTLFSFSGDEEKGIKGDISVKKDEVYATKAKVSIADAIKVIEKKYPKAEIEKAVLDEEDGYLVYEIVAEIDDEDFEFFIDAGNGKILKKEEIDEDEEDEEIECNSSVKIPRIDLNKLAKITMNEAANAAKKVINGIVDEIKLEDEDGNLFYEVEIEKGREEYKVYVDPGNGKVVGFFKDEDEDEDEYTKGKEDKEYEKSNKYEEDEEDED